MTEWSWSAAQAITPEIFLALAGLLLLIVGAFRREGNLTLVTGAVAVAFTVAFSLVACADWSVTSVLNGMLMVDHFSALLKLVILGGLIVSLLLSYDWLKENRVLRFEYPLLMLFSGVGMMFMVSATNLLSLYVSLELSSLSLYVLAAIRRDSLQSGEAGIKYFILGALSSGLLLFGVSLVYGFVGSTDYDAIGRTLLAHQGDMGVGAVLGMVFILAGLAFKVSAVPFHMWTPDVYQGAPTPVTAFFAIVPKVAAIAMIVRLLTQPFQPLAEDWSQIVAFMAVASMAWGAFAGLVQTNIKRLLAYSSIANMGYALIGVLAAVPEGQAALILYVLVYMVMTAGVFAIILSLRRNGEAVEAISDLAGLSKTSPFIAYCLLALMFSMSGIPPLAGFFSKLFIFQAAVETGHFTIAVIGVLTSVVGAYYYLRIIKVMFFDEPHAAIDKDTSILRRCVTLVSILFVLAFCLAPTGLLDQAQLAAGSLYR